MSLEKCFAVYFPLKSKTVCTVKTAKWATGIVGFILAGYDSVYFFALESVIIMGSRYCVYSELSIRIIFPVDSVLYSYGPFSLICITNVAIVFKFMTAKYKSNSTESTDQALAKSATRGTAMVVTVSITFLLLTAPSALDGVITFRRYYLSGYFPLYRAYMNLTQYLNHSINGVLYCIVGSRFRGEIIKIICRKEKPELSRTI